MRKDNQLKRIFDTYIQEYARRKLVRCHIVDGNVNNIKSSRYELISSGCIQQNVDMNVTKDVVYDVITEYIFIYIVYK